MKQLNANGSVSVIYSNWKWKSAATALSSHICTDKRGCAWQDHARFGIDYLGIEDDSPTNWFTEMDYGTADGFTYSVKGMFTDNATDWFAVWNLGLASYSNFIGEYFNYVVRPQLGQKTQL